MAQLAEMTQSEVLGDPDCIISNACDLQSASPEDISFLSNPRYEKMMKRSKAGAIFIASPTLAEEGRNFLVNSDPTRAFQTVLEVFYEGAQRMTGFSGIHPTAVIHETSILGRNVTIGPHAVIDQDCRIGDNTFIGSGAYLGTSVAVGEGCLIHPRVTIRERCIIGNNVVIHPGAVIGSCGFGFTTDEKGKHHKLCQMGIVTIGDDVEIGANTTIDRSRFKSTVISKGTKIDNLVQIAHGVHIGEDCIIVAQTGIAGSTEVGRNVVTGGQVGIAGHLTIHPNVAIAAQSGVSKSIREPGNYRGTPLMPLDEYNRKYVHYRRIDKLIERVEKLEKALSKQE